MKDEPINKYVGSVLHTHRKKLRYSQEYVARRLDAPPECHNFRIKCGFFYAQCTNYVRIFHKKRGSH